MRHRHATSRTAAELQCSIILVSLALDDNAEDGIGEASPLQYVAFGGRVDAK
jgi:hypothetical protein